MEGAERLVGEGGFWGFFQEAPISLWKVDFSEIKAYLDSLRNQGLTDLRDYFTRNPEEVTGCAGKARVVDVNSYTLELFKAGSKRELYENLKNFVPKEARALLLEELLAIAGGVKAFQGEMINMDLRGERIHVLLKWVASPSSDSDYGKVMLAMVDLTARVAAEERLKEGERLYRMLADNAQDLVCVFDKDFIRRYVSPSYETVLGYKPEDLMGKNIFTLLDPEEAEAIQRETEGGDFNWSSFIMRSPFRSRDGDLVWVDTEGTPLRDEEGELTGMMMVSRVVTGQVEAEGKLKESEKLYRMLADNANDLICMCDSDLIRTYVSPSYETVLGYKPEELMGLSLFSQLPPEEREFRKEEFIDGWFPDIVRRKVMCKDGRYIWVDTHSVPIHDESGDIAAWMVVSRDVNEKAEAEERLRESERLYRMLADNTSDLICVNDLDYIRRYVSPSYKTVLGYEPDELLGQPVISLLHPEDLKEARRVMSESAGERTTGVMRLRNRHKDGHYVWLESQGTPLFDEEDNPVGGLTVSRVVTEQVKAEEALRETNERLKDFLSVAAHELRHPINLVQGYVGTLRDFKDTGDTEMLDDIYSGITRSSGRLVRLVEELLEVSRIDQGRFNFRFMQVQPRVLVEEAAEELKVRGADNAIEVKAGEGVENWLLDSDKFRQLMVILLENASNYSPEGTPLEVELKVTGAGLEVSVADRGRGVNDDERERIFQRFYQSDEPLYHSVPGLGMGLYIAREIVEGHGGEIHHEPRPGGGSIFRLTIPGRG